MQIKSGDNAGNVEALPLSLFRLLAREEVTQHPEFTAAL